MLKKKLERKESWKVGEKKEVEELERDGKKGNRR